MNLWQAYLFVGLFVVAVDFYFIKKFPNNNFVAAVIAVFIVLLVWPIAVVGAFEKSHKWREDHDAGR
jgi:membrane protein YdbS with pleckstrin-like domain